VNHNLPGELGSEDRNGYEETEIHASA
jgi:hypothetical protein